MRDPAEIIEVVTEFKVKKWTTGYKWIDRKDLSYRVVRAHNLQQATEKRRVERKLKESRKGQRQRYKNILMVLEWY